MAIYSARELSARFRNRAESSESSDRSVKRNRNRRCGSETEPRSQTLGSSLLRWRAREGWNESSIIGRIVAKSRDAAALPRQQEIAVARLIAFEFTSKRRGQDLQILIVTESVVVPVRPVAVADDADLAVHKVLRVSRVEEQHRQGEDRSDDPYDDRDAQGRLFPHTRPQRVHDGHVAETKRAPSRTSKRTSRGFAVERRDESSFSTDRRCRAKRSNHREREAQTASGHRFCKTVGYFRILFGGKKNSHLRLISRFD